MGLLGDPFGKEEIGQLKSSLTEKANEVIRLQTLLNAQSQQIKSLESSLSNSQSELSRQHQENSLDVARLSGLIEEEHRANVCMSERVGEAASEIARLTRELDTLNITTDQIITASSERIETLEKQLAVQAKQLDALRSESEEQKSEIALFRAFHDDRDSHFEMIEADLASKARSLEQMQVDLAERGKKLDQARWKFQQQAEESRKKELNWKQLIEPQLMNFEAHLALDEKRRMIESREVALVAREKEVGDHSTELIRLEITGENLTIREADVQEWEQLLSERETEFKTRDKALLERGKELDIQTASLDKQARELDAFRARSAQLDDEAATIRLGKKKLKEREIEQQDAQDVRLAEVRHLRSELRKIEKELDQRKAEQNRNTREQNRRDKVLSSREDAIEQEDARLTKIQSKNTELRSHNKDLKSQLDECEQEREKLLRQSAKKEKTRENGPAAEIKPWNPGTDEGDLKRLLGLQVNTPLTLMGYRVGHGGIEDTDERHDKLLEIIRCPLARLPKAGDEEYMREWGEGRTGRRIRCIASRLSWDIGFQGKKSENWKAREHWLKDLKWLKATYKDKIPADQWPSIPRE